MPREYEVKVSEADTEFRTVDVEIYIINLDPLDPADAVPTERSFTLSYFDFPLIDNTRLSNDQRFALALSDFTETAVKFEAVVFPGSYATQREGPTIPAVIQQMIDLEQRGLR